MSVNLIFKIAAVGILVSVLSQVLKHSGREEQAFLTSFAGLYSCCFGLFLIFMNYLNQSRDCFRYRGVFNEYCTSRGSWSDGGTSCSPVQKWKNRIWNLYKCGN